MKWESNSHPSWWNSAFINILIHWKFVKRTPQDVQEGRSIMFQMSLTLHVDVIGSFSSIQKREVPKGGSLQNLVFVFKLTNSIKNFKYFQLWYIVVLLSYGSKWFNKRCLVISLFSAKRSLVSLKVFHIKNRRFFLN